MSRRAKNILTSEVNGKEREDVLEELDLLFWPMSDDFLCDESGLLDVERLAGRTVLQPNSKKRNKKY